MSKYTRSDLALENIAKRKSSHSENAGILRSEQSGGLRITEIASENGGRYVTVCQKDLWKTDGADRDRASTVIASEIRKMLMNETSKQIDENFSVLIAGIGNEEITADAIGPLTVKNITVTRHLKTDSPGIYKRLGCCSVSALSPGVLGQTGIETAKLIKGAVENSVPDAVIAIDALAARSCERLAAVVQISNCGIEPGSGIGNTRVAICKSSLGVPVISVGIPTVVDSSVLVFDALHRAGIKRTNPKLEKVLKNGESFFVTPKEGDVITRHMSELLAESLEKAFSVFRE